MTQGNFKLASEMEDCFINAKVAGQKLRSESSPISRSYSSSFLNSSQDLNETFLKIFSDQFSVIKSGFWNYNDVDYSQTIPPLYPRIVDSGNHNFFKETLGKLVIPGLSNLDQRSLCDQITNSNFNENRDLAKRKCYASQGSHMHRSGLQNLTKLSELEFNSYDAKSPTKTTSRMSDQCLTRVIIHQLADAEEHFSKALSNLHVKSWSTSIDSISKEDNSNTYPRDISVTRPFPSTIKGAKRTGSDTFQNIAELAVEKHFEKSLANFRNKLSSSKSPVDLSGTLNFSSDNFPAGVANEEIRNCLPIMHRTSTFPSELLMLNAEFSDNSNLRGSTFNPKKNWLALYGMHKEENVDGNVCNFFSRRELSRETGVCVKHLNADANGFSNEECMSETRTSFVGGRKRNKSACCSSFEFGCMPIHRRSLERTYPTRSYSSPPTTIRSVPNDDLDKEFIHMPEFNIRTMSGRLSYKKISKTSLNELEEILPKYYCKKPNLVIRTRGFEVASPSECEVISDKKSFNGGSNKSIENVTPTSSPTDTSGFFSDSTYSLDSKFQGLLTTFSSIDSCPTSPAGHSSSQISRNLSATQYAHHCRSFGEDVEGDFVCEILNSNYPAAPHTVRNRTVSDTGNTNSRKRSRSVVVDSPVDLRIPKQIVGFLQEKPVKFSRHQ